MNPINPPFRPKSAATPFRWFPVKNDDVTDAPPNALMLITGMDTDGRLTVVQPTADNMDPRRIVIANANSILAGSYGQATMDVPWWVANGDSMAITAVSAGSEGGTRAGSWVLGDGTGFFVLAVDGDTDTALVMSGGGGGGSGDEIIKITTNGFYQDTAGSPSPLCYFGGTKQDCTSSGGYVDRTGGEVYVVNFYGYSFTVGMVVVYVMASGGAHLCKDLGFSYSPGNAGPAGTAPGSRRCWGTTEYAAGIDLQCVGGIYTIYKGG